MLKVAAKKGVADWVIPNYKTKDKIIQFTKKNIY